MNFGFWKNTKVRCIVFVLILIGIAALAWYIRMRSFGILYNSGNMMAGPDGWYYLRQAELSVANNLGYVPYDPYMLYPGGGGTRTGSLFVRICAVVAILAGYVSQTDLINILSFVPPVMAVCMVPVMFFLGKKCGDWKCGILAALFIAVLSGQYLARTMYGYIDHHAAETLFSTLFCLCYSIGLAALKDEPVGLRSVHSWKKPILYGLFAGFTFFLGFQNHHVMTAFALITAVFTFVQFVLNQRSGDASEYLVVFNSVTFGFAALGYLIFGLAGLNAFSLPYLLVHLSIVVGTIFLYAVSRLMYRYEKPWYVYLISVLGIGAVCCVLLKVFAGSLVNSLLSQFDFFFTFSTTRSTIGEMSSWTFPIAFNSFNVVLLLALGGCIWLVIKILRERSPVSAFVLVWSVVFFAATCAHVRFEYYFVVCVALLAGVCFSETFSFAKGSLLHLLGWKRDEGESAKKSPAGKAVLLILVLALSVVGAGISASASIGTTTLYMNSGWVHTDWIESCHWLEENTPDTGVPFLDRYSATKTYESAHPYGVMSWWDYGYYIMEIGKRMPTSNPGQAQASAVARIFVSTDEEQVSEKLDSLGVRYIMTDGTMCWGYYPTMCTWANPAARVISPYSLKTESGSEIRAYSPAFYQSLLVRLHAYGGSKVSPGMVKVVFTSLDETGYLVVDSEVAYDDVNSAWRDVKAYNRDKENVIYGGYAFVVSSDDEMTPNVSIPALRCFRLVYESSSSYVDIFEFVNGAVIPGEGVIECKVVTNTGRTFTYRQESVDGTFTVPYVTGKNGDVTASAYRIVETGEVISVPVDAVTPRVSA